MTANTQTSSEQTTVTPPNEASEPGVEQQQQTPAGKATTTQEHDGMIEDTGLDPQEEAEEAEKGHS